MAPGVREIDGADKRDRYKEQDCGDQGIEDHFNLLKFSLLDCKPAAKGTSRVFNDLKSMKCAGKSPKADNCWLQYMSTEYWNWGKKHAPISPSGVLQLLLS